MILQAVILSVILQAVIQLRAVRSGELKQNMKHLENFIFSVALLSRDTTAEAAVFSEQEAHRKCAGAAFHKVLAA